MHSRSRLLRPACEGSGDGSGSGVQAIGTAWPAPGAGRAAPSRERWARGRKAERRVRSAVDRSREKPRARHKACRPVPRTDTRGLVEYTKAIE
jgi:hypothetical protein